MEPRAACVQEGHTDGMLLAMFYEGRESKWTHDTATEESFTFISTILIIGVKKGIKEWNPTC